VSLDPAVFLIGDPAVLAELRMTGSQSAALAELALDANESAFRFRDLAPEAGVSSDEVPKLNERGETKLSALLDPRQHERLKQISRRVKGPLALMRPDVAEQLGFTAAQQSRLARLSAESQTAFKSLRSQAAAAKNLPQLYRQIEKVNTDLQKDLLSVL